MLVPSPMIAAFIALAVFFWLLFISYSLGEIYLRIQKLERTTRKRREK